MWRLGYDIKHHAPNGPIISSPDKPFSSCSNVTLESLDGRPVSKLPLQLNATDAAPKVCSHADRTGDSPDRDRIDGVTGVILAGGVSSRMGANKALLKIGNTPLIETIYRKLCRIFRDVIIITNTPGEYAFIPCRTAPDIFPDVGSIAGLHSGLVNSSTERIFVVACDMPLLNAELIRRLCAVDGEWDAVVPVNDAGYLEPLHAIYARSSLDGIQEALDQGNKSILLLFDRIRIRKVEWEEISGIEGAAESFRNVNTPEDFGAITKRLRGVLRACGSSG